MMNILFLINVVFISVILQNKKIEVRMIVCVVTNYSNMYWFDAFLCKSPSSTCQTGFKSMQRICYETPLNVILIDILNQTIDIDTQFIRLTTKTIDEHYCCMLHKKTIGKYMKKIYNNILAILEINKK
jgi:hypothetical protein